MSIEIGETEIESMSAREHTIREERTIRIEDMITKGEIITGRKEREPTTIIEAMTGVDP